MPNKMTRISIPGLSGGVGFMDHGECSKKHMIFCLRQMHEKNIENAKIVLSVSNEEFQIDVVNGPYSPKIIKTLQKSTLL